MFGRYYIGENRKLFRPKPMLILLAFLLVFGILSAVIYHINYYFTSNPMGSVVVNPPPTGGEYTDGDILKEENAPQNDYVNSDFFRLANPSNIDAIIAEVRSYYDREKVNEKTIKNYSSSAYYYKSCLTMLEYMKENNVYGDDVRIHGYGMSASSSETFMSFTMGIFFSILLLYGIVVASGFMANEYRRGTIKMMMIRPVNKVTVPATKLLALFTHITAIAVVTALLTFAYGCIAYGSVSTQTTYMVFNSSVVLRSTVGAVMLNQLFFQLLNVLCAVTLTFALGAVLRNRIIALVLGVIISMGVMQFLFDMFNGSRFLFSWVIDLTKYFTMNYTVGAGNNFFLSLGLLAAYMTVILTTMFVTVKKRDIV